MKKLPKLSILFILLSSIFFSSVPSVRAVTDNDAFVTRQGTKFYLNGNEFKFVGFNLFDAAGSGDSLYSCPRNNGWFPNFTDQELDTAMKEMKAKTGTTVLRFWAFQKYTNGGTDWNGIDKVIRLAKANGLKLLPALEDGPGYCTEPGGGSWPPLEKWKYQTGTQTDTWYTDGYKVVNAPYVLSYRDYVKTIVTRYKDEPTILGWMMVNEADTSAKFTDTDGRRKTVLVNFAKDIGPLIKSIDTKHLITVGTQSNGASGGSGQDFIDLYSLSVVDFAEAHDWGYWGNDQESIPGGIKNADGTMSLPDPLSPDCLKQYQAKIGCSLAQSVLIVQKPFVIGESGIAAVSESERITRASLIDKKMKAFFDNGGAGYVYWQWNKILDSQHYDVLQGSNDPIFPLMKKYAGRQLDGTIVNTTPYYPTTVPSNTVAPTITKIPTTIPSSVPKSPTPTSSTVSPCGRVDINKDGVVDLRDYTTLVTNFLKPTVGDPSADINQDGAVDLVDYSLLVKQFLKPCNGSSATLIPSSAPTTIPSNGTFQVSQTLILDKTTVARGTTVTGTVKYKNNSNQVITIRDIVIAGRPPGGTNLGGPHLDFRPAQGGTTLQPGQEIILTASRPIQLTDPVGQWYAFSTYSDDNGYHDDLRNVFFTVQ